MSGSGILNVDIQLYLSVYDQLKLAVDGLDEEQLKRKEAPGKWSITEVLAHLADHNIVVSFRIREILAGSDKILPGFAQDPWVEGQRANESSVSELLDAYAALLQYNAVLFRRLTEADWEKTGVNFKGETVTLASVVNAFTAHVQTHLAQIERIKTVVTAV
ncbi:DinB family protein [Paenibacillus chitinolyticus]|uniref:DinB family protein n=1 Tax=Paenibacillus chitinolyticus TaxID=79263 RepID=UPI003D001AEB